MLFHKTHKQNVFAVIEIHTSGNFIDNMVFGDQWVSTKQSGTKPNLVAKMLATKIGNLLA